MWAFDPAKEAPPETIDHYKFGAGAKLAEQAYCGPLSDEHPDILVASPYGSVVGLMAMTRWKDRRLVVIGDYADSVEEPAGWDEAEPCSSYYGMVDDDSILDVSEDARMLLAEAAGYTFEGSGWQDTIRPDDYEERMLAIAGHAGHRYVIASGCGEFIRPEPLKSPATALAMPFLGGAWGAVIGMLAISDGQGGGDLMFEPAGRWAYTNVGMVPEDKVDGMTDVTDWVLAQDRFERWVIGNE